ncbi:MAG: ABC transporter permease [Clostridia bacterium]|nr:ABC transporter permease [Clostridia bacterium]MBR6891401.1 ABC transporter permease [Clostridia bacterium]
MKKTFKDRYTAQLSQQIAESEIQSDVGVFKSILNMLRVNKAALLGLIVIVLIALTALAAPLITRYDPNEIDLASMNEPPSAEHWFGTDDLGQDVFTRVVYGGRISLMIGFVPSVISLVLGTLLGLMAGYMGKRVDAVIMRLADVVLAYPSLLLAMVVMYTLGASILNMFIALSVINWAGTARVVRAQTLSLKEKEFVEAARSMGVSRWMIVLRHILPNCVPNLIVLFTLDIPGAIMWESSMSFLGVGDPNAASWGLMVSQGKGYAYMCPWLILAPGLAILITVMAFNFLGDGLRDAIDPYMKT